MNNSNFRFKLPPVLLLYILTMIGFQAVAQSGKVFRDYNADGVKQATEPLIAGVIVKAYTAANAECATTTTTTVADGSGNNYSLTGCSGSVRVEFTIPTAVAAVCGLADNLDYAAYGGAGYGSSVQFTTSTGTANFAVGNPHQYASPTLTNPKIFTSCYVSGNNLGTGNVGDADAFIGVDYNPTGNTTPAAGHYANTGASAGVVDDGDRLSKLCDGGRFGGGAESHLLDSPLGESLRAAASGNHQTARFATAGILAAKCRT